MNRKAQIDRRGLMKHGSLAAAGSLLPNAATASGEDASSDFDDAFDSMRETLLAHFSDQGFAPLETAPIVTGDDELNGGLRYDIAMTTHAPGRMLVQPCARISDIDEKDRHDLLPIFHIFACQSPAGETPKDMFVRLFKGLTGPLELDRDRMVFVSVADVEALKPVADDLGLDWERQVIVRDRDEARKAGDGSGYWRRPDDQFGPAFTTVSVHYRLGDGAAEAPLTYPLTDEWTELGEMSLDQGHLPGIVLGIERLVLAQGGPYSTWNERLVRLLNQIDRDAMGDMPPGRQDFADS